MKWAGFRGDEQMICGEDGRERTTRTTMESSFVSVKLL